MKPKRLRKKDSRQGLTLLELLIAVAIVGILSLIAMTRFSSVHFRTIRAEALPNLRVAHALVQGFLEENGAYDSSTCPVTLTVNPVSCRLSNGEAGVNYDNPFGFAIANPQAARYNYYYQSGTYGGGGTHGRWIVFAALAGDFVGCPSTAIDAWYINYCGRVCNYMRLDPKTCASTPQSCGNINDCSP